MTINASEAAKLARQYLGSRETPVAHVITNFSAIKTNDVAQDYIFHCRFSLHAVK
jgi:predicted S18 family serine protease